MSRLAEDLVKSADDAPAGVNITHGGGAIYCDLGARDNAASVSAINEAISLSYCDFVPERKRMSDLPEKALAPPPA